MKNGDRVETPQGKGTIVDAEAYSRIDDKRYGIKLDDNPFFYPVAYYWTHEITKDENQTQLRF